MFSNLFEQAMDETASRSALAPSGSSNLVVVSVGGSVLFSENTPDTARIRSIASSINSLSSNGFRFGLVVGGGPVARTYISAGRDLQVSNFVLDELGISITRANAFLFLHAVEKAHPFVLTDLMQARPLVDQGKIPVFGGLLPGFTTDAVAALLAEKLGATFVNLSNVNGIYSSNPTGNSRAKLYRELSFEKLFELASKAAHVPGQNFPVDLVCAMILKRSKVLSMFVNADNMPNFESAVRGQSFTGTLVDQSEEAENLQANALESDSPDSMDEEPEIKSAKPKKKNPDDYFPF